MEPKEPENASVLVDEIIRCAKSIVKDSGYIIEECESNIHEASHVLTEMETIRSENEDLRTWGQYWKDQYDKLEKEFNDLKKEQTND